MTAFPQNSTGYVGDDGFKVCEDLGSAIGLGKTFVVYPRGSESTLDNY